MLTNFENSPCTSEPRNYPPVSSAQRWDRTGAQTKPASFSDLVKLKGGEYFFSPCLSFLKKI